MEHHSLVDAYHQEDQWVLSAFSRQRITTAILVGDKDVCTLHEVMIDMTTDVKIFLELHVNQRSKLLKTVFEISNLLGD